MELANSYGLTEYFHTMWNTRYYCWHYYQPSFALSPSPYRNVYELDAAERLMNEANRREKRKTYFTLFLCRRLFFFVFSTRTILRAQRQIVTCFFFLRSNNSHKELEMSKWISLLSMSFVHCFVYCWQLFFSFGIFIHCSAKQFNNRILHKVKFALAK